MSMTVIAKPQELKKHKFVELMEDGSEFVCELPIDAHFNDGTGVLYYKNLGLIPFDEYMEKKHQKEVKARMEAESKAEKKK